MHLKSISGALLVGALTFSTVVSAQTASPQSSTKPSAATQAKMQELQQRALLVNRFTDKFLADAAAQGGASFNALEWKRELGMRLMYRSSDSLQVAMTAPNLAMAQNELFNSLKPIAKHASDDGWDINFLSTPCRIVDTRSGGGGLLGPAWRLWYASNTPATIAGQGGNAAGCGTYPNADGFLLYVTVVPAGLGGPDFLTVQHEPNPTPPSTSTMNYYAQNIANFAIVSCNGCGGTSTGGFNAYASRNTNVVVDLLAWTGTPGAIALDCTTVSSSASFLGAVAVSCAAGYSLTGGGCRSSSINDHTYQAYPSSANTFACGFWPETGDTIGATLTAYGLCCRVPPQ